MRPVAALTAAARAPSERVRESPAPALAPTERGAAARLGSCRVPTSKPQSMQILRGVAVSPGIAIGPALVLGPRGLRPPRRPIDVGAVADEIARLGRGLAAALAEARAAETDARQRIGPQYADILAAHARMIDDPVLRNEAEARIRRDQVDAEHAVDSILDGYAARLESLSDRHLAARAADVRDIQRRILDHLSGRGAGPLHANLGQPGLVLTHDLSPSETAELDPTLVLGFATEAGGMASHTAIVAAALEIPAVVGLGRFLDRAQASHSAIIDGDEGLVVLDPDAETLGRYRRAAAERAARFERLTRLSDLPAETLDGHVVHLVGNIEFPAEADACLTRGAEGIGLYRTDFLYLNAERPPTEEEQYVNYEAVVRSMQGRPVTIRTLDLGADKVARFRAGQGGDPGGHARHPALGLRSLRLSLREPELFRPQLRAILRAAALGDVRIMLPMVTTLTEFRQARALLNSVAVELAAEGVPARADLPLGIMIEVPAAVVMADKMAEEVDFFSIGTNDLIQYALAVDRTDETVADLYSASDPAVLRLIAMVVEAARRRGLDVTVCGAMGGDPLYTTVLLGLGVGHLSMPPHQLPEVKRVVRGLRMNEARALALRALDQDTAQAVNVLLRASLGSTLAASPQPPSSSSYPAVSPDLDLPTGRGA
ncbi:phosphoenolpyruvate--protein phosphotransferase [Isosphaeraceae bacterium EP7]